MADQNQDGKGMISSGTQPGPGERMRDDALTTGSPGTSTSASSAAGSSGGMDADFSGGAGRSGSSSGSTLDTGAIREGSSRIADQARQYAGDMASRAKDKGRSMFDQQKETAVGQVSSVANAIRSTAGQLQGEGQDQVARYVGMLADQLESLGGRLREKDLDTLVQDAQNMARRAPGTFFIGTVAVGFLLARFLKSSSTSSVEYRGYSGMQDDEWRSASATSSGAYVGGTTGGVGGVGGGVGGAGSVGSGGMTGGTGGTGSTVGGRGVGADGTPGTSGTTIGSSTTPVNGSGAGGTSI